MQSATGRPICGSAMAVGHFLLLVLLMMGSWCLLSAESTEEEQPEETAPQPPRLIVILVDGVRWDYMDDLELKGGGFHRMEAEGVRAEYVDPVFPSNSYPNWYSIVTGLYPESHGMVQNYMYDKKEQSFFTMLPDAMSRKTLWWDGAEPIWVTAERKGLRTAAYWWGGCEVMIRGSRPVICERHEKFNEMDTSTDSLFRKKMDEILEVFYTGELSLAMMYYGAVDYYGHHRGPNSKERIMALRRFDGHLSYFLNRLDEYNLTDSVTVMVVSDHGMAPSGPDTTSSIDLDRFQPYIKYMLNFGSSVMIEPNEGMHDLLFKVLTDARIEGLQTYTKETIPDRFHFKNNDRVLPLLLLTIPKYFIRPLSDRKKTLLLPRDEEKTFWGFHGYDPDIPDMRTIFYARGPGFKKGHIIKPISNVDHYNLMCKVLRIPSLPNNGSWNRVKDALDDSNSEFVFVFERARQNSSTGLLSSNAQCYLVILTAALITLLTSRSS